MKLRTLLPVALALCLSLTSCKGDSKSAPASGESLATSSEISGSTTESSAAESSQPATPEPISSETPVKESPAEPPVSSQQTAPPKTSSDSPEVSSTPPTSSKAQPPVSSITQVPASSAVQASTPDTSKETSSSKASTSNTASEIVKITFPEGTTVARISDLLSSKGVADSESFFQAVASMDVSAYPLAAAVTASSQRCFRLEGYLFPDTYEFYVGEGAESALKRMLSNTEKRITQTYRNRAAELGITMDEAITLASIIQKEASTTQTGTVSSVLHNRLNTSMKLQCDVTIKYVEGAIKPYISGDINRYNAYYNTYKCAALPAGAICNPGLAALKAALWPEETSYLYFAFDTAGNYYYSETYEEHIQKCQEAGIAIGGQ